MQLALLHFLNGFVLSDAAPDALLPLLRRHVATRHLRAYMLLLQFGAAAVAPERRKDAQLQLRQLGFLLASRRLLTEQMQVGLVSAVLQDGGAVFLTLDFEVLAFYSRVLLCRASGDAGTAGRVSSMAEGHAEHVNMRPPDRLWLPSELRLHAPCHRTRTCPPALAQPHL